MKKLIQKLHKIMDDRGQKNYKSVDFILSSVETWAWGLELTEKEQKAFWKAKEEFEDLTMFEICEEVVKFKKVIDRILKNRELQKNNEKQKN